MTLFRVSSQANELAIEKQKVEQCRIGVHLILAYRVVSEIARPEISSKIENFIQPMSHCEFLKSFPFSSFRSRGKQCDSPHRLTAKLHFL
jgi:hypothetical protein